jgi:hypothetical protein
VGFGILVEMIESLLQHLGVIELILHLLHQELLDLSKFEFQEEKGGFLVTPDEVIHRFDRVEVCKVPLDSDEDAGGKKHQQKEGIN